MAANYDVFGQAYDDRESWPDTHQDVRTLSVHWTVVYPSVYHRLQLSTQVSLTGCLVGHQNHLRNVQVLQHTTIYGSTCRQGWNRGRGGVKGLIPPPPSSCL